MRPVLNPTTGRPNLLTDWFVGPHSTLTYVLQWDGSDFGLVPVRNSEGEPLDGLFSDGGGVILLEDGSVAALREDYVNDTHRIFDIYLYNGSAYQLNRSFLYDASLSDTTVPLTFADVSPLPGASGWASTPVRMSLFPTDDHAVASTQYTITNQVSSTVYYSPARSVSFTLTEGRWTVSYQSTDVYGNVEPVQSLTILVDSQGPATSLTITGSQISDGSYIPPVTVSLEAAEPPLADGSPGSGLDAIEYSLDDGQTWQTYSSPSTITALDSVNLMYRATDIAGNSTVGQQLIRIHCSVSGLIQRLDDEYAQGHITSNGVYQSLRNKLEAAQSDLDKGQPDKASKKVQDFIAQVNKEKGKGTISAMAAAALTDLADCVVATSLCARIGLDTPRL